MQPRPLANRRTRAAKAGRGNPIGLILLLYSQKPRQRVTLARTASPTMPATEARVRTEVKTTHAGITSSQRNECTFSHSKKTEHKLENMPKGKGKGTSKSRLPSPKREDGACFAFQKGKCDRGSACKYRHELIKNNSARRLPPRPQRQQLQEGPSQCLR